MLIAAVERLREKLPGDAEFHVLSLYGESPGTAARRRVEIIRLPVMQLLGVLPLLAVLHRLLGWIGPIGRMLRRYPPLDSLVGADVMLDLSGISFVDGRGVTLLYNICCLLPALVLRVPVFKMSQALGPFGKRLNRGSARTLLPRIRHIFSRGRRTSLNLESLSLTNWSRSDDLAFLLGDAPATSVSDGTPGHDPDPGSLVLGVAPSQVLMDHCSRAGVDYIGSLAAAIDAVTGNHDTHLVVLAHSNLGETVRSRNNDHHVCRSLYDSCSCPGKTLVVEDLTPEELRGVIAGCDVFIASRFHAMISALCVRVPVMVTSWSHKYREVMEEFECGEWVLASGDLDGEAFHRMLTSLIEQRRGVSELIARHLPAARFSAMVQIDEVVSFLHGGGQ